MPRVALVSAPYRPQYMRNARCDFVSLSKSSWYPIWLGQAGAYLERQGHKTWLLDAQVNGWSLEKTLHELDEWRPDWVVVYTGRLSEASDILFADHFAAKGISTVFVGPYASMTPEALLQKTKHTKFLVQREFELPLRELVEGKDFKDIPNLLWKDGETVKTNPLRPLYDTATLDSFPLTSTYFHQQLNIYNYKTPSELYPFLDVMSGRGCAWGRCNFCLWVQSFVEGSVYKLRSIGHFMGEFEYVSQMMPEVRSLMIQDDMLTNSRAQAIAEGVLERGIKLPWSCYAKPNSRLTGETLKLMKRSGCLNLHVGFESGDDAVLEAIDKGSTVEQAKEFAALAHEAGLHIHGDFAMGHFGETQESMERTVQLAKAINPHTAQFQVMIPFRGTKFWNQLEEKDAFSTSGEPSYETMGGVSSEAIRSKAKEAYRRFYISPAYFKKIVTDPKNYFFNRFDQYWQALPAVFWRRWEK